MPYVVQMHGEPGSGKTTLAKEIARALPGVALELDVTTDALIRVGVDPGEDGASTYEVHYSLATSLLLMGHNVVLDNPVFRERVELRSESLSEFGSWLMIECVCSDEPETARRLASRERLPVQSSVVAEWRQRPGTRAPHSPRLVVDTTGSLKDCVLRALEYITSRESSR